MDVWRDGRVDVLRVGCVVCWCVGAGIRAFKTNVMLSALNAGKAYVKCGGLVPSQRAVTPPSVPDKNKREALIVGGQRLFVDPGSPFAGSLSVS